MSVTRIAVDELETHWKRVLQGIRGVVNHDGFLVLAPVTVRNQRLANYRKCGERANAADFRSQTGSLCNHRTG